MFDFRRITSATDNYNFHSHTQFCDGRADMSTMADAACSAGMKAWGFSPHSPVNVESPCNMLSVDVSLYIKEASRLREAYAGKMEIFAAMEIDFISREFGPHIGYFRELPLDYRIGSVHFVPTQKGEPVDCDGSYERFARNLQAKFQGDLRYVVEKYFGQVLEMLSLGGFDMLGHADKIAGNAALAQSGIEDEDWYADLIRQTFDAAESAGVAVEINTKSLDKLGRFFPACRWWSEIPGNIDIVVNSDTHFPDLVNAGRREALAALRQSGRIQ